MVEPLNRTYDKDVIQAIVDEYRLSEIQSEAEVRSKLIIPLTEALGYSSQLRGEEFPVYGYGGREALRAKDADFVFFTDKSFGKHRTNTQANKEWVREHSLLIIEAKKPGQMPEDMGQAQFYTMWTKAVAYVETDGEDFRAYFFNPLSVDYEIINSKIEDLPNKSELWSISYENLLSIKESGQDVGNKDSKFRVMEEHSCQIITEDAELNLPNETLTYVRNCMGKNADGLTNIQLVSRFLNITNSMLQNDIRYGIPTYMIDIPRAVYTAKLYIDNMIFPLIIGEVTEYYCNDMTRYLFISRYIDIDVLYSNNELINFEIGYHILDKRVSERLNNFELVRKCLDSREVRVAVDNELGLQLVCPAGCSGKMWTNKQHVKTMFEFWLSGMNKLKAIEDYYEIEFDLKYVSDPNELNELYDAIDFVYDGIMLQENCEITLPGNLFDEDFEIEEPVLFENNKDIPLPDRVIQGVVFRPYRSAWLPSKVKFSGKVDKDIVRIPGCCEYKIVE